MGEKRSFVCSSSGGRVGINVLENVNGDDDDAKCLEISGDCDGYGACCFENHEKGAVEGKGDKCTDQQHQKVMLGTFWGDCPLSSTCSFQV